MHYKELEEHLCQNKNKWLITGVAGFIGSHLLHKLLNLDQEVVGIDNFSTGFKENLKEIETTVGNVRWNDFTFIEGDILDSALCPSFVSIKSIVGRGEPKASSSGQKAMSSSPSKACKSTSFLL